jgi:hypothetical protein
VSAKLPIHHRSRHPEFTGKLSSDNTGAGRKAINYQDRTHCRGFGVASGVSSGSICDEKLSAEKIDGHLESERRFFRT